MNQPFLKLIFNSPFRVAPERDQELAELLRRHGILGEIDPDDGNHFCASVLLKRIWVGLPALERIWAYCYAAMYVYTMIESGGFRKSVRLGGNLEGERVRELLRWALLSEVESIRSNWPGDLPRPDGNEETNQILRAANHLFLHAVGFGFLHEVGHIVHHHLFYKDASDVLVSAEFEADRWAYNWIMQACNQTGDQNAHLKRAMFIAFTLAIIGCIEFYGPEEVEKITHPNPIDRLLRFLNEHAKDQSKPPTIYPWLAASTVVQMHLTNDETFDHKKTWPNFSDFLAENRGKFQKRLKLDECKEISS